MSLHTERMRAERKRYVRNILARWDATDNVMRDAGACWYAAARKDCAALAHRYGKTTRAIVGAAAAISPGMRWDLVLRHVELLLLKTRGHKVPTYSKMFVARARRCLKGEAPLTVLGGPKVTAFYMLILDQRAGVVVVDGHAFNIARGARESIRGHMSERLTLARSTFT